MRQLGLVQAAATVRAFVPIQPTRRQAGLAVQLGHKRIDDRSRGSEARNLFAANGRRASDSGVPLGQRIRQKAASLAGAAGSERTPLKPKPGTGRRTPRLRNSAPRHFLRRRCWRRHTAGSGTSTCSPCRKTRCATTPTQIPTLLSALDRMFVDVEMEDIELFFDHWEVTSSFIVSYFFIEEPVWYARLAKRVTINGPLSRKERTKSKSEIGRMLQTLRVTFDSELVYLPPSEALRLLREKINKAVSALLSYLTLELKLLPDLIEKYVPVSEKDAMEEEIFAAWFNGTDECYAVMAVKWLKDPGQRKFFEKKHIDKKKRKKEYLVKVQHFEEHHAALVREVNERSKRVVVDMLQGENETGELVPEFYKAEVDDHFEKEWEWVDGTEVDQELVQQSGVVEAAEDPATAVAH
ncbi:hypothetical protein FVE85_9781 [Porphyridium purpureum]|uniref:Uncharacterized protein n=1 Tax=Porphyridium purpureum TaxID=35688 RepID=A0A5J4YM02_PORPP|nr:hypothetical protein FVE85_9781 [Porphyridium purpureum]|eukprot:POR7393..scf246_12